MATRTSSAARGRKYNVRADTLDFRDLMYEATLIEVPTRMPLADYRKARVPVLNQGQEGACTGFGLATVAHFLLRMRHVTRDPEPISPRMFYQMAKRYDEWSGEDYDGSSARGAMKGWHKHGVCSARLWPYDPKNPKGTLSEQRARDAARRPLGAYYRVRHHDIVAMHAALAEVGVLYATASVHAGWNAVGSDGVIPWEDEVLGGHAFAIVAYDERGFWMQNSWDTDSDLGRKIESCTLWAPACTMALFEQFYLPAIQADKIGRFALFTLTDAAEQDDNCASIYHKSLLYLVSNAFENPPRIPLLRDGVPLLGMEKFISKHAKLGSLIRAKRIDWVKAPNTEDTGSPDASGASHHGDFDDDPATVKATLARVLDRKTGGAAEFSFRRTAAGLRQHRGYFNR